MNALYTHIAERAAAEPKRTALVDCNEQGDVVREISYTELLRMIDAKIAELKDRTDPLLLEGESRAEFLITSWAAWCAGVTVVPLDQKRDTEEMRAYKAQAAQMAQREALILFTSGTTARPKGARLTLESLLINARDIAAWLGITKDDRFLVQLPLHHINSTTFCLSTLVAGGTVVLPPRYSASHFWEVAANTRATLTSVVQTIIFDQLLRTKEYEAVKDKIELSRIQIGSAPVVPSAALEFIHKFSIPLYQGYGQTETALRVTGMPMDLPTSLYEQLLAENSIGTPLPWADVEITDEAGEVLGEGDEGELVVRGPALMQGYVAGEEAFRDGWFLTGDVGLWKKLGGKRFFFLKGRKKELVIKGGVNISPIAVESALLKINTLLDQAYVVGVPDERYGEEVAATLVWKSEVDTARETRKLKLSLLAGTPHLSAYEAPRYLLSMHSADLPLTSTGKVQRIILKQTPVERYQSVQVLFQTSKLRFEIISPQSPLFTASHTLYNHCWQPLTQTPEQYKKFLGENITLGAVGTGEKLAGQISFLLKEHSLTCVSICSATYTPKPMPEVLRTSDPAEVEAYIRGGKDPVINFHTQLGATIETIIQNGRPQDKSSLGYTVLLRYPTAEFDSLPQEEPVSRQLIAAARIIGKDMGFEVCALSRPGGLAAYLSLS